MRVATLQCWHCGAVLTVTLAEQAASAYDLVSIADKVGWYGDLDVKRSRALIFCCKSHADAERTQKGYYRVKPRGVQK